MIKKLKKRVYIIFIKSVFQSSTFSFRNLIIFDSEIIIHVFNDLSWFSNFWKALYRDYFIVKNSEISILSYKNVIFCTDFVTNLVFFFLLKKKNIYWNTINNILFHRSDCSIIRILKETARQQMIKKIRFSNILVTSWIHQKISWASHLSFKENNVLWHACMRYSKLISFHKLSSICLDVVFWNSSIMKCKVCNLAKIKQQISW